MTTQRPHTGGVKRAMALPTKPLEKLQCADCGKPFLPKIYYQRYCSTVCRTTAYWRRRLAKAG